MKIFWWYLIIQIYLLGSPLSEIPNLNKLKNFEEIKNIEVDNVYDYATSERVDGILYNGEKVVEGVIVRKNNKNNILGLFFYENGQSDGINYQYFSNGNLSYKALYEKDILVFSESYLKDGYRWMKNC